MSESPSQFQSTKAEAQERIAVMAAADKSTLERLAITVEDIDVGRVELSQIIEPSMANGHGLCHGGFLFALADTGFAYAVGSLGSPPVTQQASFSFIRGVKVGERVRCVASVSHAGRSSGFATAKLYVGDRLVAEFQGSGMRLTR